MSKTIKMIELLIKSSKGEEVPKKIKFEEDIFELDNEDKTYTSENGNFLTDSINFNLSNLNDEVEIIEDEVEIDIQSIEEMNATFNGNSSLIDVEKQTINELVKAVKQLDKNIKELR